MCVHRLAWLVSILPLMWSARFCQQLTASTATVVVQAAWEPLPASSLLSMRECMCVLFCLTSPLVASLGGVTELYIQWLYGQVCVFACESCTCVLQDMFGVMSKFAHLKS